MKAMDLFVSNKDDEYYTPIYAIKPIMKYIPAGSKIWCPFDTPESYYVKEFTRGGYNVVATHICNGEDFFKIEVPECGYIVSNPPYSCKGDVLQRLFDMGKPFAMLVGVAGLFESKKRFQMFKEHKFEIMYFNKRISYFKSYEDAIPTGHPPFSSVYVCSGILPKQIVFEEVEK